MHGFKMQKKVRLMGKEIVAGMDELGALLMGDFGALWYGSQLTIQEAREILGDRFNATSLQIASPVLAGAIWMIENPKQGLLEPEDLDHDFVLDVCRPYLGKVVAARGDWTPLKGRAVLFPEPAPRLDGSLAVREFPGDVNTELFDENPVGATCGRPYCQTILGICASLSGPTNRNPSWIVIGSFAAGGPPSPRAWPWRPARSWRRWPGSAPSCGPAPAHRSASL